jgi:hypothetical protein
VKVIVNLGIMAILGVLTCVVPMVLGAWFAFRPGERLLALMRPLTLAAVFAAVSNTMLGLVNTLHYVSLRSEPVSTQLLSAQLAETLAVPFLSFGCLAAAWVGIAVGMRKQL